MDYKFLVKELFVNLKTVGHKLSHSQLTQPLRGEKFVLHYLTHHANGDVTPSDISCAMNTSTARTAAALNSLEDKGLITRAINKNDRRQIIVQITEKGARYAKEIEMNFFKKAVQIFDAIGEDDAKELVRIIAKIASSYDEKK